MDAPRAHLYIQPWISSIPKEMKEPSVEFAALFQGVLLLLSFVSFFRLASVSVVLFVSFHGCCHFNVY